MWTYGRNMENCENKFVSARKSGLKFLQHFSFCRDGVEEAMRNDASCSINFSLVLVLELASLVG